jgi:hypothetical protein
VVACVRQLGRTTQDRGWPLRIRILEVWWLEAWVAQTVGMIQINEIVSRFSIESHVRLLEID